MAQRQSNPENNSRMEIPDYAIERIARCMLPMIQSYYESEEGQRELSKWKAKQEKNDKRGGNLKVPSMHLVFSNILNINKKSKPIPDWD